MLGAATNPLGTVAGNFNIPESGSKVYGGMIPSQIYVTPDQLTINTQIIGAGPVGSAIGGTSAVLNDTAAAIGAAGNAVTGAAGAVVSGVESVGKWTLIVLGLVAAIVIAPRVLPEKR